MVSSTSLKTNYFPALTGIRAIAAYMVYFHHFNPFTKDSFLFDVVHEFHVGVTIFFVLSGFLICYRYYDNFGISRKWFSKYMLNRFARIYPIYFILSTLTYVFLFNSGGNFNLIFEYFLNITFLKGFFSDYKFSGIAQGWSLTVEECFYIAAPFIFLLYKGNKFSLVLIPVALISTGVLLVLLFSRVDLYSFFSTFNLMILYTFFGRCVEFIIGIVLALVLKSEVKITKFFNYKTQLGIVAISSVIIIMSLIKGDFSYGLYHPVGIILNNFILPVFIALLFWGLVSENTYFRRLLESNFFSLLGKSSYVFYLIHVGIFYTMISKYVTSNYLVIFVLLNILSIILFTFIEEPINKRIRMFFKEKARIAIHA